MSTLDLTNDLTMLENMSDMEVVDYTYLHATKTETSEVLAELLLDTNITAYKSFENMAVRYLSESDDFRKGMDYVLAQLTERNLREIAEDILRRKEEML